MSIHQSLKISSNLTRSRNVLTRFERLERLKELGKWDEAKDSVFHLPKTKSGLGKKVGKKKKKKEEEGAEAAPGAVPAGATPAVGAKGAAPAPGAKTPAAVAPAKGAAPAAKAPAPRK